MKSDVVHDIQTTASGALAKWLLRLTRTRPIPWVYMLDINSLRGRRFESCRRRFLFLIVSNNPVVKEIAAKLNWAPLTRGCSILDWIISLSATTVLSFLVIKHHNQLL